MIELIYTNINRYGEEILYSVWYKKLSTAIADRDYINQNHLSSTIAYLPGWSKYRIKQELREEI